MHPEVVSSKPGTCPKCGMALTPIYAEAPAAAPAAPAATPPPAAKGERKIKYWVDPMDPNYVRDKPGKAPCGMDLVPVYEEAGEEAPPAPSRLPRHRPVHGRPDRQGGGAAPVPAHPGPWAW